MKYAPFILLSIAATAVLGCTPKQEAKSLVIYYSVSGTTEAVAKIFQEKTGADIARIEAVNPYENDFKKIVEVYQQEMEQGVTRDIEPLEVNLADYDTIYIGTPVWFGKCAGPVETFLKNNDLKGKTVIPFCTFGSGGNTAAEMMQKMQPEAGFPAWYGVRTARVDKAPVEVEAFLAGIGAIEGTVEELREFSAFRDLTEEEKAIFEEACGSYPLPLGSPDSVASRDLDEAAEYIFKSIVKGFDGKDAVQEIYVTKGKAEGSTAEFTQVMR